MEKKINLEEFLKFPSYDKVVKKEIIESNSEKKLISKKFFIKMVKNIMKMAQLKLFILSEEKS